MYYAKKVIEPGHYHKMREIKLFAHIQIHNVPFSPVHEGPVLKIPLFAILSFAKEKNEKKKV